MTPAEALAEAQRIVAEVRYPRDWEAIHSDHDELCFTILRDLGYGDMVDVMEEQTRWYA